MIIGITGLAASGKDAAARYLQQKDFRHISLAEILRDEATKRHLPLTRTSLHNFATKIKQEQGFDVLAQIALRRMKKAAIHNFVVTAFRHPDEVAIFQQLPSFILIYVEAPVELRYKRAQLRHRTGDTIHSFDQFLALERAERGGKYSQGQSLDAVIKMAQYTVDNTKDLPHLYRQIDQLLEKTSKPS